MSDMALERTQVALEANAGAYRRVVQTSAPGDCWDYLILTAANEKQAQGYRQELGLRHRVVGPTGSFFPAIQRSIVVADPAGRRAGSGGATLGAMRALCEQFGLGVEDLGRLRILLIHSGGASQRLPAYSPLGKIFAPLPLRRPDGQICTLFDHLYLTLAGLPERLGPGMLIVAGDVFLVFDHRHVSAPGVGVTALTMRVEAELARSHGVFVTDGQSRVLQTLQKASPEAMEAAGAMDENGEVLIDTGLLFFDAARTRLVAGLSGISGGVGRVHKGLHERHLPIDLYDDMTAALAFSTDEREYVKSGDGALRRELWKELHGVGFRTMVLEGQFLHLGTTRQFRDAMVGLNASPAAELFQQNVMAYSGAGIPGHCRVYHSAFLPGSGGSRVGALEVGKGAVIEHSILSERSRIGAGSVVSQVLAVDRVLDLPENVLLFQVPIRWRGGELLHVHVVCGVEDDLKGGYPGCSFMNRPMEEFLGRAGLRASEVWPGVPSSERTLWTARLFPGTAGRDAADGVLWFATGKASSGAMRAWKKCPRFSMAMLLEQADPVALIEHREVVAAYLQTEALLGAIVRGEDKPLEGLIGHYTSRAAYDTCLSRLKEFASAGREGGSEKGRLRALQQSRAYWVGAQLLQRPDHPSADARLHIEEQMSGAFGKIAEASEPGPGQLLACGERGPARLVPGVRIESASPVRLDLSGGWSDTPPYCYEQGGHVVNVAINLDGHPPVRAMVRTIGQPMLILESNDLGTHVEVTRLEQLQTGGSVHDPFALHKVALRLVGLLPEGRVGRGAEAGLEAHLRSLGAGLIVTTECRVPKGSGLGTSSILAATLLSALDELFGPAGGGRRELKTQDLISRTLLLEQRLSTGGGWQDQIGGIVGGLKSTTAVAGVPQAPVVERLGLSEELYGEFQDRLVVYYSGQQRLARDILRRVMGRYLAREPAALMLLEELKRSAGLLRGALLKGQWVSVAREIGRYWELKKQLYPGSTTPTIDVLFMELRELYLAAGLAGAGGGGFAYFFCRNRAQAGRLREALAARASRPGSLGALFQTQINREGLCVVRKST